MLRRFGNISKNFIGKSKYGFISHSTSQSVGLHSSVDILSPDKQPKKQPKTPIGKLDNEESKATAKDEIPDPYAPFPDGKHPVTGEVGGPRGPEPTRYGDWERKGRVSDF